MYFQGQLGVIKIQDIISSIGIWTQGICAGMELLQYRGLTDGPWLRTSHWPPPHPHFYLANRYLFFHLNFRELIFTLWCLNIYLWYLKYQMFFCRTSRLDSEEDRGSQKHFILSHLIRNVKLWICHFCLCHSCVWK